MTKLGAQAYGPLSPLWERDRVRGLPVRRDLTGVAKTLRRAETDGERQLWRALRNRQMDGWKFRRQVAHGPYVLDFLCFEAGLVVELDGGHHLEPLQAERDARRTTELERAGLRVIRFMNSDVLSNMPGVVEAIYLALGQRPAPSPGAKRRSAQGAKGGVAPASPQGERRMEAAATSAGS
ncbi:MAG: DUF559 domain-containing protein [Hyphomicrobiales bacterium]|nr:MAG: DUF559 domain-containing protein [Hyphomicrobiales bacterium]